MRIRYRGEETEFVEGFWMEKNESCEVCGAQQKVLSLSMPSNSTLQSIVDELKQKLDCFSENGQNQNQNKDEQAFISLWAGSRLLYAEVRFVDCSECSF